MTEHKRPSETPDPAETSNGAPCVPDEPQPEAQPDEALPEEAASADHVALEAELADTKERLLRALAETENLRRRAARDLEEAHKYAITNFARELLDVADNLSRALAAVPPRAREEIEFVRNLADGVAMTEKALLTCFERHQISKVEPDVGARFDHNRHQAMFEVPTAEQEPGTIAQVMQPGYTIADRLLRPALVGVAKPPAREAPAEEADEPQPPDGEAADGGTASGAGRGARLDTTA